METKVRFLPPVFRMHLKLYSPVDVIAEITKNLFRRNYQEFDNELAATKRSADNTK
jgi:hypothetical protein